MTLPIFLFTDFGSADIYVGQVKAALHRLVPQSRIFDLLNDAPPFAVSAGAHLLSALVSYLPARCVVLAVVDPGVGSERGAVALEADGRWFVGPDNGLLSVVAARAASTAAFGLDWLPAPSSVSFHGRDLFAPAAAEIARGGLDLSLRTGMRMLEVRLDPSELPHIIYIDHYGNAITGVRARTVAPGAALCLRERQVPHARVFSAVPKGALFWYENSIGLVELAANQESAASLLGLKVGDEVAWAADASNAGVTSGRSA